MKIAIVGSGISGLVCARLLHRRHDVTLFEADDRVGGHSHTVSVADGSKSIAIDTGFIVHNDRTYPNFSKMLALLGVETRPTTMSFSVRCDQSGLEYNGTNLNGLFAQRRNLVRPKFWRMTTDILRFNRQGMDLRHALCDNMTVGEFTTKYRYSNEFIQHYLLPMGAAIWSCPAGVFAQFPIQFILEFYANHGLLSLRDRPLWKVIPGGSGRYVEKLTAPFRDQIRVGCPVRSISRQPAAVHVSHALGSDRFDEVILACHSDQARSLLEDPGQLEDQLLGSFPYSRSEAVLHSDESLLPRSRRAWAAWNYHLRPDRNSAATLTYNMNLLQHLESDRAFLVTLNETDAIAEDKKIAKFDYAHPVFTTTRRQFQARHAELIRHRRTSYCGAWWGAGFHEDGVNSALQVCHRFGVEDWAREFAPAGDPVHASSSEEAHVV